MEEEEEDELVEEGPVPDVPASFQSSNSNQNSAMIFWLKKHGKALRPKLSAEQKSQMLECFELMDQDGSGAIDAGELGAAFKLLGINMKKSEMEQLVVEVDHDGSGEVEYQEFLEIMTTTLQRLAEEAEVSNHNEGQVPFALMATAYRRKRLMEGIISGDKEVQAQITEITAKANAEAVLEVARKAEAARAALTRKPTLVPPPVHSQRPGASARLNQEMMASLPRDERRAVEMLSRNVAVLQPLGRTQSQPMAKIVNFVRAGGFTHTAMHRQLLQMPEFIDVRLNRSSIRLPPALSSRGGPPGAGGGGVGGGGTTYNAAQSVPIVRAQSSKTTIARSSTGPLTTPRAAAPYSIASPSPRGSNPNHNLMSPRAGGGYASAPGGGYSPAGASPRYGAPLSPRMPVLPALDYSSLTLAVAHHDYLW